MPGLATRLLVASKVADDLKTDSTYGAIVSDGELRKWYMFGALGPAVGDFMPITSAGLGAAPVSVYFTIWQDILKIAVGDPSQTPPLPGVVPTLRTLTGVLGQISSLVAGHDFGGMIDLKNSGAIDTVNSAVTDLATILQFFTNPATLKQTTNKICALKPVIDNTAHLVPAALWSGRDWLHWKHTGAFAHALWTRGSAGTDKRYFAYAMGWQVAFATLLSRVAS